MRLQTKSLSLNSSNGMGTILIIILLGVLGVAITFAFMYVNRMLSLHDLELLKKSIYSLQISLRSLSHSSAVFRHNFELTITPNRFTELRDCINSSTITEACRHPFSLPLQADTASPPFVGSRSNPVRYGFRGQMCDPSNSDEACPIHFFNECVVRCPEKEPNDLSGVCPQVKRVICNHYLAIVRFFFLMSPEALNSGFREHRFTLRLNNSLDRWLYLPE